MKVLTCASYYGTGSSAITDLFSEYDNVHPATSFEFRFAHDPDGLMDLEYHLVENFNREVSGYALKRFVKFVKYNHGTWFHKKYETYFHGKYLEYSNQYIDTLTDFKFKGYWHYDLLAKGKLFYNFAGVCKKINRKFKIGHSLMPRELTYCSNPGQEKFLEATRTYTTQLVEYLNDDQKPYIVIDQLVPSTNTAKCLRYFSENMYVFIVDRDPRDVYILCRTSWRHDHLCPRESVEMWCKWYRYVRENSKNQATDKIMYVQFEDLVYRYEDTIKKIEQFSGLKEEDHVRKFARLNPKRSFYNTQIYSRNKKFEKDIKVIEEMLPEFLYDFDKVKAEDVVGIDTKTTKTF